MSLIFAVAIQAAAVWTPPAQATWVGLTPKLELTISAGDLSMKSTAPISVELIGPDDGFSVSPFLNVTRGIAFKVENMKGVAVGPAEPIMTSPPAPPFAPNQLITASRSKPLRIETREEAKNIFPGAGTYRLQAIAVLMDTSSTVKKGTVVESKAILVEVKE